MPRPEESSRFYYEDHFALPKSKIALSILAALFLSSVLIFGMAVIIYTPTFQFKKPQILVNTEANTAKGYLVTFVKREVLQTMVEEENPSQKQQVEKENKQSINKVSATSVSEQAMNMENNSANTQNPDQKLTSHITNQLNSGNPNAEHPISPVYPQFALLRNIEGYVVVEYTINSNGTASQIIIIESEPKNVFDTAVIKAIKSFKHSPNIINGEAEAVFGVRNRFEFKIQN